MLLENRRSEELVTSWDVAGALDAWRVFARENGLEVDDPQRNVFVAERLNAAVLESRCVKCGEAVEWREMPEGAWELKWKPKPTFGWESREVEREYLTGFVCRLDGDFHVKGGQ
jgi:hypothetical protein